MRVCVQLGARVRSCVCVGGVGGGRGVGGGEYVCVEGGYVCVEGGGGSVGVGV